MKYWNALLSAAVVAAFASASAMASDLSLNYGDPDAGIQPQVLGADDRDLVFTPVTPCRILDTRVAGGIINAASTRHFQGAVFENYGFQGGADNDCGIPLGVSAIQVNLALVNPAQAGYATAFPFGEERPLAASINYLAGLTIANEVVIPMALGGMMDFSLYSHRQAHAVADVSGYYMAPEVTPLDCVIAEEFREITAAGAFNGFLSCPAGYTATGGTCTVGVPQAVAAAQDLVITASEPGFFNPEAWYCAVSNTGAVTREFRHMARCCRIPGR